MRKLWIEGEFTDGATGQTLQVVDPATEEVVDVVPKGGPLDVDRAVAAAKRAFPGWKRTPALARAEMLVESARRLRQNKEEFAVTLTRETGRTLRKNRGYVDWSATCFDYYAGLIRDRRGRVIPSAAPGQLNLVLKEPLGIVGCIVPFNYPLMLLAWKVAPALAAGNTVVIKPASATPLLTLDLHRVFDHLPKGVVNIITGSGGEVGDALVKHPDVPCIAFTGSTSTGQHIYRLAADGIKKLHLELGGSDAAIICADCDLEAAARAVAWTAFLNAGQVCTSAERVYVEQSVYRRFLERFADLTQKLVVGAGMDERTEVTPLIGRKERDQVEARVAQAQKEGARVVAGGRRPPQLSKGWFYEPTVLADARHGMSLLEEEIFGPVAPIMPFTTFDEALHLANDSPYGLGATLFSSDAKKVRRYFEEIEAGNVWVNDPLVDNPAGPFGGMKMSGLGRELGEEGLEEFQQTKHVHWDIEASIKPWWYPLPE
ncbi:MAG: aldehyde dehydrogenase [Acidobacteria bacterium 13_1_40CM_2_68_10]|nr:MAG: aldehyde dehydrogenase [Acidobacteria bacterium 13_1_40CM_2_68_10]OLE66083.1 MAG: aldehyde dehydrogenase [Acidobacteria bacterium 13_1_20CM_2_68_14]